MSVAKLLKTDIGSVSAERKSLIEVLLQHHYKNPKDLVYSYLSNDKVYAQLTYADLMENSLKFANLIKNRVGSNQKILISLSHCPEFICSFLGCLMSGNVPVPMTTPAWISSAEFTRILNGIQESTESPMMITKSDYLEKVEGLKGKNLQILEIESLNLENVVPMAIKDISHPASADLCFLQFSSGSTGAPKGVQISHFNLLANIEQMGRHVKYSADDVMVTWIPAYHDMGLIGATLSSLYYGFKCYLLDPVEFIMKPYVWPKAMTDFRATFTMAPNFAYHILSTRLKPAQIKEFDLRHLRVAYCGAEPVNPQTYRVFCEKYKQAGLNPKAFYPVYGMAEITLAATFPALNSEVLIDKVSKDSVLNGYAKPATANESNLEYVSCGSVLEDINIKIISEKGQTLNDRAIGEICLRSPSLTAGYYHMEKINNEVFTSDHYFKTGDLGYLANNNLFIIGRTKDTIVVGGKKYSASDIEWRVSQIEGIRAGRLTAIPVKDHKKASEKVQVIVESTVFSKRKRSELKQIISRHVSELISLSADQVTIVPPETIKKTTSGKLRRHEMKNLFENGWIEKREKWFHAHLLGFQFKQRTLFAKHLLFSRLAIGYKKSK